MLEHPLHESPFIFLMNMGLLMSELTALIIKSITLGTEKSPIFKSNGTDRSAIK